jgi:hypothetical protein
VHAEHEPAGDDHETDVVGGHPEGPVERGDVYARDGPRRGRPSDAGPEDELEQVPEREGDPDTGDQQRDTALVANRPVDELVDHQRQRDGREPRQDGPEEHRERRGRDPDAERAAEHRPARAD